MDSSACTGLKPGFAGMMKKDVFGLYKLIKLFLLFL